MNAGKKRNRKSNVQGRIIERQMNEIEALKNKVSKLEIDCRDKDDIINSIDSLRIEMNDVVKSIRDKSDRYDELIEELNEMKMIMNEEVFHGKWNIIRLLMR